MRLNDRCFILMSPDEKHKEKFAVEVPCLVYDENIAITQNWYWNRNHGEKQKVYKLTVLDNGMVGSLDDFYTIKSAWEAAGEVSRKVEETKRNRPELYADAAGLLQKAVKSGNVVMMES